VWDVKTSDMTTAPADRANLSGQYPPGYYYVMGFLAGPDAYQSAYFMRITNIVLAVLLLMFVIALAPRGVRQAGLLSLLAVGGPMGWFIVASNNPSSWAFVGVAVAWIGVMGFILQTNAARAYGALGVGLLGGVIAASARVDAAAYTLIVIIAITVGAWLARGVARSRAIIMTVIGCVVGLVVLFEYFAYRQGTVVSGGAVAASQPGAIATTFDNIVRMPGFLLGGLGFSELGWLDTPMPNSVAIAATMLVGALIFVGLGGMARWTACAWLIVLASLIAIPTYVFYVNGIAIGQVLQPRYVLPLLAPAVGIALVRNSGALTISLSRGQFVGFAALVTSIYGLSLYTNIRRYVTGLDQMTLSLSRDAEWWSNSTMSPNFVWIIGTLSLVVLLWLLRHLLMGDEDAIKAVSTSRTSTKSHS
jgi:hypothetical protein